MYRNSHPTPIYDKTIGKMTFSEFYKSVMNLEVYSEYHDTTFRIFGFSVSHPLSKTWSNFKFKDNKSQKEYHFNFCLYQYSTINDLKKGLEQYIKIEGLKPLNKELCN